MIRSNQNKIFLLVAIFFIAMAGAYGQPDSIAIVSISKIYNQYQPLVKAKEKKDNELIQAKWLMNENIRKKDSIYCRENLIAKNQSELDPAQLQAYDRHKKEVHKEQFKHIEKVLIEYQKNISSIELEIKTIIEEIKNENGYTTIKYYKKEEEGGKDITDIILKRLNQ